MQIGNNQLKGYDIELELYAMLYRLVYKSQFQ